MRTDTTTGVETMLWLFGGLALIFGIAFRTGLIHGDLARQYRDLAGPDVSGVFALIPIGLGCLAAAGFLALKDTAQWAIALGLVGLGFAGCIFGIVVMRQPTWWLKPKWLRNAEADGWRHYERPPFPTGLQLLMASAVVVVMGAGVAVMLSHATTVELIGAVLTGLGVTGFYIRPGGRAHRRWVMSRQTAATAESEREHVELLHHLPPHDVIKDPKNRLILRRSVADIAWMSVAESVFFLVFVVEVMWLAFLGRPPIVEDSLFALLSFGVAAAGSVGCAMIATSRLELSPEGFRIRRLEDQFVWWIDVKDIRATPPTTGLRNQPIVAVRLTPAGQARARPGVVRFFGVDPLRIPAFGLSCEAQAKLMEQWRHRWMTCPSSHEFGGLVVP